MNNTMLEKAARAIFDRESQVSAQTSRKWEAHTSVHWQYREIARAALQAIREPSDEMLAPACKTHKPGEPMSEARPEECRIIARRRHTWTAMIDAILSEGEA